MPQRAHGSTVRHTHRYAFNAPRLCVPLFSSEVSNIFELKEALLTETQKAMCESSHAALKAEAKNAAPDSKEITAEDPL